MMECMKIDTMKSENQSSSTITTAKKLDKKFATDTNVISCQPYIVNNILSDKSISNILNGIQEEDNNNTNDSQENSKEALTSTITPTTTTPITTTVPKRRLQRQATKWNGIIHIDNTTGKFSGITDVVNRGFGRYDYTLTESLTNDILITSEDKNNINNLINNQLLKRYDQNVNTTHKTFHIMVVRPGADNQSYHCDDEEAAFYYTLAFPLSTDNYKNCGYTEFEDKDKLPFRVPAKAGQCLIFDGKTSHRGLANKSKKSRIFLYIALHQQCLDGNLAIAGDEAMYSEKIVKVRKCYATHIDDDENNIVMVGDIWKFHAEQGKKPYIGIIESIFLNERLKHIMLEVRWLYHEEEVCKRIKLKNKKERLYSNHLDDVQVESLKKKVNINSFFSKYILNRVYDFENKRIDTSDDAQAQLESFLKKFPKRCNGTVPATTSTSKQIIKPTITSTTTSIITSDPPKNQINNNVDNPAINGQHNDILSSTNQKRTIQNISKVSTSEFLGAKVLKEFENQVAELKDQLLQQHQSRISKKSKLLRRNSSNVRHVTPYNSSTFPSNKIVSTNSPMLLSYRKKWIDITKHVQSNYKSLDKKEQNRIVHDLFSDSLQMGKIDIVKEGEGWSGGYNISGVRRGDIGNGVSQLLSQGFLRL